MKGCIMGGGTGSRLWPLCKSLNKHMLPVGNNIMLEHAVFKLTKAGIYDIVIVIGKEHAGLIMDHLGSGKDYGCKFTYKVQDEAGGIAQALGMCESFVGNDCCCVILGDNIFEDDLKEFVTIFEWFRDCEYKSNMVILKEVPDPERFGVAEIKDFQLVGIEEKPATPKSNLAVTGIYFYSPKIFDLIKTLKPSGRNELEISEANDHLIKQKDMAYSTFKGWWTDAGTFQSYKLANDLVRGA